MEILSDGSLIATTQSGIDPFELYRPGTVEAAVEAVSRGRHPVCFYAGGTDFFAAIREGLRPGAVVWLDRLAGAQRAEVAEGRLTLGAGLTHAQAVRAPALAAVPGLAEAWGRIATVRIRRHATLGGNLMARRPRYELHILLSALSARATIVTPEGSRDLPVEDLWDLPAGTPALLVSVAVPLAGDPRLDYARDLRPTMTQALCLRTPGAGLPERGLPERRLVVATEYLRPHIADLAAGAHPDLPADFHDPVAGHDWLSRVSATQLDRQKQRMTPA